jgi:integrase/recombinase XerD
MQLPTVNISLDRRYSIKKGKHIGKYHAKVWITFLCVRNGQKAWKQKAYETNVFASPDEFAQIWGKNPPRRADLQEARDSLRLCEAQALNVIKTYETYTQKHFESYYLAGSNILTLKGQFELKAEQLKTRGKIGSAEKYKIAFNSFAEFAHKDISFQEITDDWLNEYETWMTSSNDAGRALTLTTVGINCRCLRHIFNRAIKAKLISPDNYPFGEAKYIIPQGGGEVYNVLTPEQKELYVKYRDPDEGINEFHDYTVFSYYANGLNASDIARLRNWQLHEDYIEVDRQKTKGKKKKIRKIIIPIHPAMREILNRRRVPSEDPDDFVFGFLTREMSEEQIFFAIRSRFLKRLNRAIKHVFGKLGFAEKPTTYTMRHTFAGMVIENNGTTEELQFALGHASIKTTEAYKHGHSLARMKTLSDKL